MVLTVEQIVESGLCIGCGLCQALAEPGAITLVLTPEGCERPAVITPLPPSTIDLINEICPGTRVEGAQPGTGTMDALLDPVWGPAEALAIGYSADAAVRYRASTGGVLTALGQFLVDSERVSFVLHVGASTTEPMRTLSRLSFDAEEVLEGAGSRYGPAAPLLDFCAVLDRAEPFALIAKPCDVTAVRNLARHDQRVDRYMRYALTFVCGGASDLTKSEELLARVGVERKELSSFRYRGNGNPGPTRVETIDGRSFELTYQQMWEDEATWQIQPRCRICPDATGEGADIAASDVWPGGGPTGEDDGYNGIIVRTARGLELYRAAVDAGAIVIDQALDFRDFDVFQPHQVRRKRAIWARYVGMRAAGHPVPHTENLRLDECARLNSLATNVAEARGARHRALDGRMSEPPARERP